MTRIHPVEDAAWLSGVQSTWWGGSVEGTSVAQWRTVQLVGGVRGGDVSGPVAYSPTGEGGPWRGRQWPSGVQSTWWGGVRGGDVSGPVAYSPTGGGCPWRGRQWPSGVQSNWWGVSVEGTSVAQWRTVQLVGGVRGGDVSGPMAYSPTGGGGVRGGDVSGPVAYSPTGGGGVRGGDVSGPVAYSPSGGGSVEGTSVGHVVL